MVSDGTENESSYVPESQVTTQIRAIYLRNYSCVKETLRQFDLTPVQWRILSNLQNFDGQNVNALAERSYTNRTNLSRDVATLERAGLIKRRHKSRDQRNVLVFITKAGRQRFERAIPAVQHEIDFALEGLSDTEIATLLELLIKVKHNSYRPHPPVKLTEKDIDIV
jgi:DNA-binding MarR family transcriptional regulator